MHMVQISARIIKWPTACACCCRKADTIIVVSGTREKGKRIVHVESKSWKVPYCDACLGHIAASKELKQYSPAPVVHGTVGIAMLGALLAIGSTFFCCLGEGYVWLGIGLPSLIGASTIVLAVTTFKQFQKLYGEEIRKTNTREPFLKRRFKICSVRVAFGRAALQWNMKGGKEPSCSRVRTLPISFDRQILGSVSKTDRFTTRNSRQ
jgi:hypothetical protein